MKVSFVISAYDRPQCLKLCLQSLVLQSEDDWEAIVMDNSPDIITQHKNEAATRVDKRITYVSTPPAYSIECYSSAWFGSKYIAQGDWLCFPSDDSDYTPIFSKLMLQAAAKTGWELVYCDFVHGCYMNQQFSYQTLLTEPRECYIDKTTFLLRREWMRDWPGRPKTPTRANCDGWLIEQLVRDGIRHGRVPHVLVVHN